MAGTELTVDLNARLVNFQKGMDQANKQLDKLQANTDKTNKFLVKMSKNFNAVGAAAVGALSVGALASSLRSATAEADELANSAARLGIGIEQLQALRNEAEFLGSSYQATDTAIQRFSRRMAEAAQGTGTLAKIIEENNIQLKDSQGNFRSVEDLLQDYAKILQQAATQGERNRLAMAAFDTEGVKFGQTIATMQTNIEGLTESMKEQGKVLTEDQINTLSKAEAQWTEFAQTVKVGVATVWTTIVDSLDSTVDFINSLRGIPPVIEAIDRPMQSLADTTEDLAGATEKVFQGFTEGTFESAVSRIDALYEKARSRSQDIARRIQGIGQTPIQDAQADMLDENAFYQRINEIHQLIQGGETDAARALTENVVTAMETLAKEGDTLTERQIEGIKTRLSKIAKEIFEVGPITSVRDSVIDQLRQAERWMRENPAKWEVQLAVEDAFSQAVANEGIKQ